MDQFHGQLPAWPIYDAEDAARLLDVLHSRQWWRGNGTAGTAFEAAFAAFTGAPHVRAVANGSLALELALRALGIEPGDEVIVPACTFISTASAVLQVGAWPIPVDVEASTLNMDPSAFEAAIGPRSRCVIPVHMAGQIARMPEIAAIARRHGLSIIEDAAHAHGARACGQAAGAWGDMTIYSFQSGKLMTAGEGGAVTTRRADLAERTFALHSCGRPAGDTEYRHEELATNMRLSEFQSAILIGQLRRLPGQLRQREAMAPLLEGRLRDNGLTPLARGPATEMHSRYMTMAWFDPAAFGGTDSGALARRLRGLGLPAFRCFPEVHRTGMFSTGQIARLKRRSGDGPDYAAIETPVAARAAREAIWLPHALLLGDADLVVAAADLVGSLRTPARAVA